MIAATKIYFTTSQSNAAKEAIFNTKACTASLPSAKVNGCAVDSSILVVSTTTSAATAYAPAQAWPQSSGGDTPPLQCPTCNQKFKLQSWYTEHMKGKRGNCVSSSPIASVETDTTRSAAPAENYTSCTPLSSFNPTTATASGSPNAVGSGSVDSSSSIDASTGVVVAVAQHVSMPVVDEDEDPLLEPWTETVKKTTTAVTANQNNVGIRTGKSLQAAATATPQAVQIHPPTIGGGKPAVRAEIGKFSSPDSHTCNCGKTFKSYVGLKMHRLKMEGLHIDCNDREAAALRDKRLQEHVAKFGGCMQCAYPKGHRKHTCVSRAHATFPLRRKTPRKNPHPARSVRSNRDAVKPEHTFTWSGNAAGMEAGVGAAAAFAGVGEAAAAPSLPPALAGSISANHPPTDDSNSDVLKLRSAGIAAAAAAAAVAKVEPSSASLEEATTTVYSAVAGTFAASPQLLPASTAKGVGDDSIADNGAAEELEIASAASAGHERSARSDVADFVYINVGGNSKKKIVRVGDVIKAQDLTKRWYSASIASVDVENNQVLVHFHGWVAKYV